MSLGNKSLGNKMRLLVLSAIFVLAGIATVGAAALRDDGIHTQAWMKSMTFLDLKEDLDEARKAGKGLVILFEQPGCGSCKKLHEITFAIPEIVKLITDNFDMLQINMYGANEVTDMDGTVIDERRFAERMRIHFTPTTIFFGPTGKELFRVPGFLRPQSYRRAFEYVLDKGPQRKILFPRWLRDNRVQSPALGG